ncbi:hypothetical protein [Candidatus Nitrosotalea okcheonensis]|uniref:CARDB domain-containing protein n=1 Tax=Candidatus Nitrosotalea okcheonensis TaxID=1903276 RepID=A0A2H1FBQ2_9ARCH|nr:hypothetical protein [Candidatus Nitrosotalea okcheonensis]SMH70198.1 conserved exported protein of unknown function [Candidatus Nitrosotalea okcheonensis]
MKTSLFLLGSILLGSVLMFGFGHSAMAMNSNIVMTHPVMVDTSGQQISSFHAGQQIGVESSLTNNGPSEQKFAYMVQVLGSNDETQYFESTSASMLPNQTFTTSQVWIPKTTGQYTVEVFVWNSLTSAVPLTDVSQIPVTVH